MQESIAYQVYCPRFDAETRRWSFRLRTDDEFIVYNVHQLPQVDAVWRIDFVQRNPPLYSILLRARDWQDALRDFAAVVKELPRFCSVPDVDAPGLQASIVTPAEHVALDARWEAAIAAIPEEVWGDD